MKALLGIGLWVASALSTQSAQAITWSEYLRGHWRGECRHVSLGRWQQNTYTFSDMAGNAQARVIKVTAQFYDGKCSRVALYNHVIGQLNLRDYPSHPDLKQEPKTGASLSWMIHPLLEYPYVAYNAGDVADLNRKDYCGKSDWAVGQAQDILKTDCEKEVRAFYSENWFQLAILDGNKLRLSGLKGAYRDVITRWEAPASTRRQ